MRVSVRTHWVKAQLSAYWRHCYLTLATPSPPTPRPPVQNKKIKKIVFLGFSGGAVGVLAGCVGCLCVLLRFGFPLSLPKVAGHGGDVGDDSWLKWQSTLLTVLRHSWICRRHIRARLQCNGNQGRSPCPKHGLGSQNFTERRQICDSPL